MAITKWYLKVSELPVFSALVTYYLEGLRPHQAAHWELDDKVMLFYKESLLSQLRAIQNERCAYCGLGLERTLVDREHFAHKGQKTGYPEFVFNIKNLFASCDYCNRRLKGAKDTIEGYSSDYDSCEFKIVHPYLDDPDKELTFVEDKYGDCILVKEITPKGGETIRFFQLNDKHATAKRAGYIVEKERYASMAEDDFEELKRVSGYKPA